MNSSEIKSFLEVNGNAMSDAKENGNREMGDEARYGEGEVSSREKGVEKIRLIYCLTLKH